MEWSISKLTILLFFNRGKIGTVFESSPKSDTTEDYLSSMSSTCQEDAPCGLPVRQGPFSNYVTMVNRSLLAWLTATDWPAGGEIDIVEGVHNQVFNLMSLHTNPGCTLDASRANANKAIPGSANTFVGRVKSTNCDALVNSNTGCSIQDTDGRSFGIGLNGQRGGVYATLWDGAGIKLCTSVHRLFCPCWYAGTDICGV